MDAHWFAKLSIDDFKKGKDCSHTSGLCVKRIASVPDGIRWSRLYQSDALDVLCSNELSQPRSDLSRHHFMIAYAIGGSLSP
jgi:hypothetical protein